MTTKQKIFVKEYVASNGNATEAAAKTYNVTDRNVARSIGAENLTKPAIRNEIDELMQKHELTIDKALLPISKALKSKKAIREWNYEDKQWDVVDHVDDLDMQLKASDRVLKLHGVYQGNVSGLHIHLGGKGNNYNL